MYSPLAKRTMRPGLVAVQHQLAVLALQPEADALGDQERDHRAARRTATRNTQVIALIDRRKCVAMRSFDPARTRMMNAVEERDAQAGADRDVARAVEHVVLARCPR